MIVAGQQARQPRPAHPSYYQSVFEQANYQKALQARKQSSNRYHKGEEVSYLVNLGYFKIYGVGVYLFFSFIKKATILFLILTFLSVVPVVLNAVKGSTFRHNQNSLSMFLTKSSLGSHKFSIMAVENAYNLSISYKIVNVVFDILSCFIFLVFCLYWQRKSKIIGQHVSQQIKLQSNFTVEAVQFPPNMRQQGMSQFMSRFGTLTQVVEVRDYTKQIQISRKIYQNQLQIKQIQLDNRDRAQQMQSSANEHAQRVQKLSKQVCQLYTQLQSLSTRNHQVQKFYVQFQTVQQRRKAIRQFQKYQKTCCCCCLRKPQKMNFGGQQVKVIACNTQPSGILWQNAHVTWKHRLPKTLLQLVIILSIIIGGFILISFLNILVPQVDSDINTTNIPYQQLRNITNSTILQSWCNNNYVLVGAESSQYFPVCQKYWKLYTQSVVISLSISLIIMIICELITKVVYALAEFQQYTTKAEYSVAIMTNLFIMNFLTTTLITFLMQADIFGLSVMNFMRLLVSSPDLINNINSIDVYRDLIPRWYKDIGYQIWFNIFVMIFLPQLTQPIISYLKQLYSFYAAKKQKIHRKMVKQLQCPQFQVQSFYAELLLIIATGVIFGGGIQLMMIVVFLCLLVRYFYLKFMFIRFYKAPHPYNSILNDRVIVIMKVVLVARLLISIYMYGADDVFAMQKNAFMIWASSLSLPVFSSIFVIISRILLTWYYSLFALLFVLMLAFKQVIFLSVEKFNKWRKQEYNLSNSKQLTQQSINPTIKTSENELIRAYPSVLNPNVNAMEMINPKNKTNSKQIVREQPKTKMNEGNQEQNEIENQHQYQHQISMVQSWASNQQQQKRSQRNLIKSYKMQQNPDYEQILIIMKLKKREPQSQSNRLITRVGSQPLTVSDV